MVCLIHREQEDKLAALRSGNPDIVHVCLVIQVLFWYQFL